jgi:hypothetical protein
MAQTDGPRAKKASEADHADLDEWVGVDPCDPMAFRYGRQVHVLLILAETFDAILVVVSLLRWLVYDDLSTSWTHCPGCNRGEIRSSNKKGGVNRNTARSGVGEWF